MRFVTTAAVSAAILLGIAAGAQAKTPPGGVEVCGAAACRHLDAAQIELFFTADWSMTRPPAASSFYALRWSWSDAPAQTSYYVPETHVVRLASENDGRPVWMELADDAVAMLTQATAGLEPFATPKPTLATVGGRRVRGPDTYLRLFRGPGVGYAVGVRWLKVAIRSETPSPWTDGQVDLKISARGRLVLVESWPHKISLRLANLARHRLPLAP